MFREMYFIHDIHLIQKAQITLSFKCKYFKMSIISRKNQINIYYYLQYAGFGHV